MNKQERISIYRKARRVLPSTRGRSIQQSYGICLALDMIKHYSILELDELWWFRKEWNEHSKRWSKASAYWFPHNDLQSRLILLDFCILLAEESDH